MAAKKELWDPEVACWWDEPEPRGATDVATLAQVTAAGAGDDARAGVQVRRLLRLSLLTRLSTPTDLRRTGEPPRRTRNRSTLSSKFRLMYERYRRLWRHCMFLCCTWAPVHSTLLADMGFLLGEVARVLTNQHFIIWRDLVKVNKRCHSRNSAYMYKVSL